MIMIENTAYHYLHKSHRCNVRTSEIEHDRCHKMEGGTKSNSANRGEHFHRIYELWTIPTADKVRVIIRIFMSDIITIIFQSITNITINDLFI